MKCNDDLLSSQIRRGLNGYNSLIETVGDKVHYDVLIAHETHCSALACLYYSLKQKRSPLKILDIVEYPVFSQRTSRHVREAGEKNCYSDMLTLDFAVNLANKFDHCIATSHGQRDVYIENGCKTDITLVMNCRDRYSRKMSNNILQKLCGFSREDIVLVYPNRAYENCGLEVAVKALARLENRFKLVVLGEIVPRLADDIDRIVRDTGIQDRFFVTGMLDPSLVLPILSEADAALILLENQYDNLRSCLPNRLFDSVAARTATIVFGGTEVSKFVADNYLGVVCQNIGPESLAESIIECIERHAYFRRTLLFASERLVWNPEAEKLLKLLPHQPDKRSVLIVAIKDIRRNDRIRRISRSLVESGFSVDIVTMFAPLASMREENVSYYAINS